MPSPAEQPEKRRRSPRSGSSPASETRGDLKLKRHFTDGETHPYEQVEWETRSALIGAADDPVFEQSGVEFPAFWSQNATNIVAQKYFAYGHDDERREHSVRQLIDRVVDKISSEGAAAGYFADKEEAQVFADELTYVLLHQYASFNSPVWFNLGVEGAPQTSSACFILAVEDTLESIANWYSEEIEIFRRGSGAGVNLSRLRGAGETLSHGGSSSGPVTFMRAADASAGTIQSGGRCLAPWQRVYTERGPIAVSELAESGKDFVVLSFDPPAGRYKAKTARAWKQPRGKELVRVTTDKGSFDLSHDHPVKLSSGDYVKAGELREGHSLFACSINTASDGYLRVNLRDGQKGKERLHRLIARDVLGIEIKGLSVHHRDGDRFNNTPDNLEVMSQAEHAALHGRETASRGEHVFQLNNYGQSGKANPMHRTGPFWSDPIASDAYRKIKSDELVTRGAAAEMQREAARQKMLNTAFKVINAGHSIDTFDDYISGRKVVIGRVPSISKLERTISERFGSYEEFKQEVARSNHRVVSVEAIGNSEVYDVEVDCPTVDDKSRESGHNFVIWPDAQTDGCGIAVSNTRRAAKMVILDVDHPDIEEFVWCKAREEERVRALVAAGFDMSLGSKQGERNLAETTAYQNANNSVRVTDEFMRAVEEDRQWDLIGRNDGEPVRTVNARELFAEIAEAAWRCADPGLQYDSTIQEWHTTPAQGRISASNPCAEFISNDNSSCNLASLNLLKFLDADGSFDTDVFRHVTRLVFLAQEITIAFADFPTRKIAKNTRNLRQIGIGYTNLGALLMSLGLAYDSDAGRALAAAVTALLTGEAYLHSTRIAERLEPFTHYEANAESVERVLKKHRSAARRLPSEGAGAEIAKAARGAWNEAVRRCAEHGVRNAQAAVLAPTGTLSFMLDCDTFGVEPDFSLVKSKILAGGGTMQITNRSVPRALANLGYSAPEIDEIVAYIEEDVDKGDGFSGPRGDVGSAPHLKPEHYPVFDCAVGERAIQPLGHVRMMAAVQPFLSGAISKTVNVPAEATVEEIADLYMQGWRQGLKALAIYRDGSKASQPLAAAKRRDGDEEEALERVASLLGDGLHRGERRKLAREAEIVGTKFSLAGVGGYIHVRLFDDGTPGGLFIDVGQAGSTLHGFIRSWSVTMGVALQYGVPLDVLVSKLAFTQFEPAGFTTDPQIKTARSIVDYTVRWLAAKFLDPSAHAQLGIHPPPGAAGQELDDEESESESKIPGGEIAPRTEVRSPTKPAAQAQRLKLTAASGTGVCRQCGGSLRRAGTCEVCESCGDTSGCG